MIAIYSAANTSEADVVLSLLRASGIHATVQGYQHRSLLGILGPYIQLNVLVPEDEQEEARHLIEDANSKPNAPSFPPPSKLSERRPAVAVMMAILCPGLGSLYVGRTRLGGWLLTATALCLAVLFLEVNVGLKVDTIYAAVGLALAMAGDLASVTTYRYAKRPKLTVLQ